MSGISIEDLKKGIPLYGTETLTLGASIDLKKFYTQLAAKFSAEDCKDALDIGYYAKEGQMIGEKGEESNRSHNMFERKFFYNDVGGGVKEIELLWQAKRNTFFLNGGYVVFTLDMVCRRISNQEILKGNQKVTLQQGNWEFRNKILYFNPTLAKKCEKLAKFVPFLGKHAPEKILGIFFGHQLHEDLHYAGHKVAPIMTSVIDEHFKK